MTHVTPRIQAYLDGELAPHAVQEMRDHLRDCTACRQEVDRQQQIWHRVDAAAAVPVRPSLWPRLAERLERRRRPVWTWPYRSLAMAATLTGVLLGWQLGQPVAPSPLTGETTAAAGYLEDSVPSLDQLWLQLDANGDVES